MTVPSDRKEMDRALMALRLEVPASVADDVQAKVLAVVERYENALRVQAHAVQRADKVFAALIDFATVFVDDDPEGRIGVLSRRVIQHSLEARELIADAVLVSPEGEA